MSKANPAGISQTVFVGGLIFAIVTSSLLSTLVATQWGIAQGPKGDKGDTGPQGLAGLHGEQGLQGLQGIQGPQGDEGDIGSQGETGPQGPQGLQGIQGVQGPKGDKGDQGEQGPQGEPGLGVEPGYLVAPAWNSGWTDARDQNPQYPVFWHGLNTTNVLIYIQFNGSQTIWVEWYTENEVYLRRITPDEYLVFRVMIWKITEP